MKKILIAVAIPGMLFPAFALAELNYNVVDVGHSDTSYIDGAQGLSELDLGFSKSISENTYLGIAYGAGSQSTYSGNGVNTGDKKIRSISLSAGYHTPLKENADAIVKGHVVLGSAQFDGGSASANGYDIATGIRTQFAHAIEGALAIVHARTSNGTYASSDTFVSVQLGFNFIPQFQMTAGMDFRSDLTTTFGLRFFY